MILSFAKLGDVAPARPLKRNGGPRNEMVWHLNLDKVEANSGKVIEEIIAPAGDANNSTHWFDDRHILYSKLRPYLNKVVVPKKTGIATTELVPLLPDPKRLNRDYLAHYLRSAQFVHWVSGQVAGAKMPRVAMKTFWDHEIPLLPLPEQKRIAAILDKADAIRRKRLQAIKLSEDFLCATFLDLFRSSVELTSYSFLDIAIKEKNSFVNGPFGSNLLTSELTSSGVPVVYIRDIRNGIYNRVSTVFVTEEKADELNSCNVKGGDILIAKVGGPPGMAATYPLDEPDAIVTQDVIRIRPDLSKITPNFFVSFINSPIGKHLLKPIIVEATRSRIALGQLKSLNFHIPSIDIQRKFEMICVKTRMIQQQYLNIENVGNQNFNSLTQRAFRGEL